ncbi:hypothetical protein FKP32DRAFT_1149209 [Trametes sanguinea]|nr:hypothetical protein FKP32DRAFT_1149209 [Trametes sanguinea]
MRATSPQGAAKAVAHLVVLSRRGRTGSCRRRRDHRSGVALARWNLARDRIFRAVRVRARLGGPIRRRRDCPSWRRAVHCLSPSIAASSSRLACNLHRATLHTRGPRRTRECRLCCPRGPRRAHARARPPFDPRKRRDTRDGERQDAIRVRARRLTGDGSANAEALTETCQTYTRNGVSNPARFDEPVSTKQQKTRARGGAPDCLLRNLERALATYARGLTVDDDLGPHHGHKVSSTFLAGGQRARTRASILRFTERAQAGRPGFHRTHARRASLNVPVRRTIPATLHTRYRTAPDRSPHSHSQPPRRPSLDNPAARAGPH